MLDWRREPQDNTRTERRMEIRQSPPETINDREESSAYESDFPFQDVSGE
jgi:hypothetical protein